MQNNVMTRGRSRVLPALLLARACAAAPLLLHTMGPHRAGSGVLFGMYLSDMGSQTIAMQDLPAMTALALFELARPPVWIFGAVVPLMFFNTSAREPSPAEFTLGILWRRRFHFPTSGD